MRVFLTMMLGGNFAFLIFLFLDNILRIPFSWRYRYGISVFALVLHFLPLLCLKDLLFKHYPQLYMKLNLNKLRLTPETPSILIYEGKNYPNRGALIQEGVFLIVLITALSIAVYYASKGICVKYQIIQGGRVSASEKEMQLIEKCARVMKVNHVKVLQTDSVHRAFTMGIIHPVVVLPIREDVEQNQMLLMHELYHLKQRAALVYFLKNISLCIYWFNPLNHVLVKYIEESCEKACDEFVVKNFDITQKRKYAHLLIDEAEKEEMDSKASIISFGNHYRNIKERVDCIMNSNKKKAKKMMLLLSMMMMSASSAIPVLACEPIQYRQESGTISSERLENFKDTTYVFIPYGEEFDELNAHYGFGYADVDVVYDKQFVDQDGNIYEIYDEMGRASCQHSYKSGQSTTHRKNKDGSCIIKYYESKMCTKCGNVVVGKLLRTATNNPCPH